MVQAQWVPGEDDVRGARVSDFARFVTGRNGLEFADYHALWRWSVDDLEGFWGSVWEYFGLGSTPERVLTSTDMPGAQWFPDSRLNYVEQVVRQARGDRPAILSVCEGGDTVEISWAELLGRTAAFARTLRELGVGQGDRVAGYLPNIPEAVIAFLATASLGAVWSACGQDYSAKAALDRLGQLEPVVLVTADGYRYGGKVHDKQDEIAALRAGIPGLRAVVLVRRAGDRMPLCAPAEGVADGDPVPADSIGRSGAVAVPEVQGDSAAGFHAMNGEAWRSGEPLLLDWARAGAPDGSDVDVVPVPFDHPLWVLYSSGTTGLPKGIVHGHGGVLLEHLKAVALQSDIGRDDTFFWYTSPSWMMWNFQVAGLLVGATIVCYDGSPSYPNPDTLWDLAARTRATVLGTSPGYVLACMKADANPRRDFDLTRIRTVGITGSSLPPESSLWLGHNIGDHVQVSSLSGGTDVVSAFFGGAPTVPVWPGELSAPYLGAAVAAFDDAGNRVQGEVGELVVTKPLPSMPVRFWNDPDGSRYRGAYFDTFPGVWRHGDWITVTDRGSIVVHGRSDSTLNRHGIRMGSADIYQAVERLPEVAEALVIGVEQSGGGYWMPLFVVLAEGAELTDELRRRINDAVRTEVSPRHVPDEIIEAPGIPHTRTGKRLEVPVKRLLQGADPDRVVDRSAVDDPALLDWYAERRPATALSAASSWRRPP
ncbi:acetoacetate--CoA ligase [Nocardia mexicana]|uniref:Acetoacetyl-CoA synthetase n=1 Tax=Nocardia mexicana TaxID=279262 RepID=A0A370H0G6_9NOCA|nr:acetoacetate--CoA ligase [Nocardia mexicana]RDI49395.1 acetoacetyl-CoA synthetase [Nocardia mexicana]